MNALGGIDLLLIPSVHGNAALVKLLLENGADVNALSGKDVSAIQMASYHGHEVIVKLLLENGAVRGGMLGSALQEASYEGHKSIVKLLLENGAEVNAHGGDIAWTALLGASHQGHEGIVKLLLENGADANVQVGMRGNALQVTPEATAIQVASSQGPEAAGSPLLEIEEEEEEEGSEEKEEGSEDEEEREEECEAESDETGLYGTALRVASGEGHEGIVKLLLENGAEVNTQGWECGTALQAASRHGHETIVKLLLKNGAEVNAVGELNGTALQAASSKGHEAIVKLLLENGAEVNAVAMESVSSPSVRNLLMEAMRASAVVDNIHPESLAPELEQLSEVLEQPQIPRDSEVADESYGALTKPPTNVDRHQSSAASPWSGGVDSQIFETDNWPLTPLPVLTMLEDTSKLGAPEVDQEDIPGEDSRHTQNNIQSMITCMSCRFGL